MTTKVRWLFMVIGILAIGGGLAVLFHAGCTGDMKTGTAGDPAAALQVESLGLPLALLGCLFVAAFAAVSAGGSVSKRIASAVGAFILAFLITEFVGIEAEGAGVQHCFYANGHRRQ
jgi:hypothetical protein